MKLNLKMLAVSTALLGLLAAGAALPASAAGPLNAAAALSLPWSAAAVESVEPGTYASTMTVGTQQQLSPVILPAKAARNATVTFMSNDSTIVNVTSEGVAQAVGVGTAQVIASAAGVSCVYTITTELDESMIVKEMDITLASGTIAVGETTSLSLGVLPSSASNYASVSLSSSDPAVATVNNFGKVTGVAPGTATITATSLFAAAGLPIPFIAISQPISQIVDMGRTALNVAGAANTAVIVAQTEHQLDTDLYYGRKEYSDDLNDGEQFGQTSTQSLTETGPSQRTNITNDAKFDSANVSQQQSGFTLNFAPNAVLSASRDDACCGTKPNK